MPKTGPNRREFITSLTALAAVRAVGAQTAGGDTLRVGLVGCGGRGTGAVLDALQVDPNCRVVALADAFADQLAGSLKRLSGDAQVGSRVDVPAARQFVGFDAYRECIDVVDVVILAAPPYFRPAHLEYAVAKGVHAFAEKPVATDGPGVRQCLAACEQAAAKGLSVVSGLCYRYDPAIVETLTRVMDGAIGRITAIETNYCSGGVWEPRRTREQVGSDMEYQLRNWYYYTWLSGDHIVEQAVHALDKMGWVMGDEPPRRCRAVGGRQVRTHERYGNIYDHFGVTYEYANGVRGYHHCRHWRGTPGENQELILGANGVCNVFKHQLTDHDGQVIWKYEGPKTSMYRNEQAAFLQAVRSGQPINDGVFMCRSTMLGIMGRMAAYTGQHVTWEQALGSPEALGPATLEWGEAPPVTIAVPGAARAS